MTVSYTKRTAPTAGPGGALSATVLRALRSGAERATARLAEKRAQPPAEIGSELDLLAEMVCSLAATGRSALAVGAPLTFSHQLIDVLRTEFLACLTESRPKRVNGKEILAVLSALEEIGRRGDRPLSGEFAERLASSDALNGMLEIAHDMRSPLAAILLLVEPIRRGQAGPVTPIQERQLGLIYGATLSLSTLANDIIEASRGRCRADTAHHPFSITETIQDACAVVSPIAEEKQLELRQTHPAVHGRIGDSAAIHRVLLNLTSNALKYTERGSVSVGATELDQTRVEFWVKDTGAGIPDRVLTTLFDEFRPGPVGYRFFSSGLGLAICRTLVEGMGSTLRVETSPTSGTRFAFVLDLPPA